MTFPLVGYPLIRVTDVHEANLAVGIAGVQEADLIRKAAEELPYVIRGAAQETNWILEAGFGEIVDSLQEIDFELSRQNDLLTDISHTLVEGFTRLSQLGEAQLQRLSAIEKILALPLDTQARELRERGLRGYRYGLYDEALEDLTTSIENNVYDHIAHLHIGHIHLLRGVPDPAAEAYTKAIGYALAAPEGSPERAEFPGPSHGLRRQWRREPVC